MATNRNIQYINKDFGQLRQALINYAKTYFPTTYNDFSPTSPGMMFMEMAAYVGDVLNFYLDTQIQETYLEYTRESQNLYNLAYMFGYKPNVTGVASTNIDFYQQIPADPVTGNPDWSYTLVIEPNSVVTSNINSNLKFLIQDKIDFSVSSSTNPTEINVYSYAGTQPTYYLLKKTAPAISSTINVTSFTFGAPVEFDTVVINVQNIIKILDIFDSDGNEWYEVPYLAEDAIYDTIQNTPQNDPNLSANNDEVPYLLRLKSVQRRFVTRFINSGSLQLQFGAGTTNDIDEVIVPNPDNVGLGLPYTQDKLTTAYSPTNFIFTKTYGIAPSNTTLTVRYLTGGGVEANTASGTLTNLSSATINFLNNLPNSVASQANTIFNSVAVNNPEAASGGQNGDTIEEIRQNTISNIATQQRTVTPQDYLVRSLSLPSEYGTVAKAFIQKTKLQDILPGEIPTSLDLFVLTYDRNGNLTATSSALKQNLSTYLSQYRVLGDSVNIKDAFVINIGVDFEIIVLPNFNSNDVLLACNLVLQEIFAIRNWQINQPIILSDLFVALSRVNGVQSVSLIKITNKVGTSNGYSQYAYSIEGATVSNTIYPSLDPMIFEVKYPLTDIKGRIVTL
jgi:hypothetical protein